MIYVTGDTHGGIDMKKLVSHTVNQMIKTGDYLIICGDYGFVYDYKKESHKEKTWNDWFQSRPYTTLFVDGNHECFPRLAQYPEIEWNGGKVHKIRDHVFHLMRGQVFHIEGNIIFTMGGAASHDRGPAVGDTKGVIGKFWWPEEIPSDEEMEEGQKNLKKVDYKVDYIITHCLSSELQDLVRPDFKHDALTDYFSLIKHSVTYKHWFCGHYHKDQDVVDNVTILFQKVLPINETVGKSKSLPGSPIYKRGDSVAFHDGDVVRIGVIKNIYPWGNLKHREAPVYDIETEYEASMKRLSVVETDIDGLEKEFIR